MSRVCQLTGKRPTSGNTRSHSMRTTKRRFLPNLFKRILVNPFTKEKVKVKISAYGLKCLVKNPLKYWKKLEKNVK
ncbi:MAG: 50S ribosomal protein L28, large subunit ribosomal protein L28 [Candidatus Peregrinibacteria bacterium GW2011_GWF2_33_10]|nr:MAG: 50S ribosomal protein L28, large subunit ribosomal protein L28 [Candidatus Peregrinibacteria bacterium GW2011_GWF2_33_10]OGJ45786.1 MAG: 50S ribosomal protein L28 [Candidatus Peregrinibacteria bacterium RIFOXYA2_FULL_33_21]OGJ46846.1 MAG: 50S ribosomal protein L28 [Candidatus Peregrinibacteria bacterium RIFOXYA12_FULL_33_12]OGJ51315.1 MAG: 50S ribosomal protein L28 [Candidatus Peregrinibacteria bacterium RIFOXYB2_FULL_33_20]